MYDCEGSRLSTQEKHVGFGFWSLVDDGLSMRDRLFISCLRPWMVGNPVIHRKTT